jgi:hypothetical protein
VAVAIKDAVAVVTVCCATLKDEVVNQILNAMNFEKRMARAIEIILRHKARGTQLTGIMEKEQAEDGEVKGWDFLIYSWIDKLYFGVSAFGVGVPSVPVTAVR